MRGPVVSNRWVAFVAFVDRFTCEVPVHFSETCFHIPLSRGNSKTAMPKDPCVGFYGASRTDLLLMGADPATIGANQKGTT
jgi:hypothetical protein